MTFLKRNVSNIIFLFLILFIVVKQAPLTIHSFKQEGKKSTKATVLNSIGEAESLPIKGKKGVYVFWATWCGPCHLQLSRFKSAVDKNELPKEQVIAVNLGEDLAIVKAFKEKEDYPFKVVVATSSDAWREFNVQATPSIAHVNEEGTIESFSAGLSPLGVFKAKRFLK